jgi:type IV secretory pathway TraG/TraD family ATPase VirD4
MLTRIHLAAIKQKRPLFVFTREMICSGLIPTVNTLYSIDPQLATRFLETDINEADFFDSFLLSSWGTLTTRLQPLLTETVIRSLVRSDFTPQDLMLADEPITVYIKLPEQDLLTLSPLVRLLSATFINTLTTTYDARGGLGCKPVLLLIDEAGRTAIPHLPDAATTVVGRGVYLWIAAQDLSQLDDKYGQHKAKTLRNNCDTQLFYRPQDQATAEYIERCLGRQSAFAHSHTMREGEETSQGLSEQGIPNLTAWEIKQMRDEDIIGFHRRLPPFRAKRMDFRNFPLFRHRSQIPAPKPAKLPPLETFQSFLKRENHHNGHNGIIWQRGNSSSAWPGTNFIDPDKRDWLRNL